MPMRLCAFCYLLIFVILASVGTAVQAGRLSYTLKTIDSIEEVAEYLDSDTLVVVDLDQTVFEGANPHYGHANWFYHQVNEGLKRGYSKKAVMDKIYPHWVFSQRHCKVKPVEAKTPQLIRQWQQANIPVIAATSRETRLAHITLDQLDSIGVQFSEALLKDEPSLKGLQTATLVKDGVIFCSEHNDKGTVILRYFRKNQLHPKKMVFIDDRLDTLQSIAQAFAHESIEITALHYPLVAKASKNWDRAKANQAYYQAYLDNPVLPPLFLENHQHVARQKQLLNQNGKIKAPYDFVVYGNTFIGLPEVYSPTVFKEDGELQQAIPIQPHIRLLEIGAGTGYFSVTAALKGADKVVAVDISPKAIENTRLNASRFLMAEKVEARLGDVFSSIREDEKFDVIYWDIPYYHTQNNQLSPLAKGIFDQDHQLLTRFLREAGDHLTQKGEVYLVYSGSHGDIDYLYALANHYHWQVTPVKQIGDANTFEASLYALKRNAA